MFRQPPAQLQLAFQQNFQLFPHFRQFFNDIVLFLWVLFQAIQFPLIPLCPPDEFIRILQNCLLVRFMRSGFQPAAMMEEERAWVLLFCSSGES